MKELVLKNISVRNVIYRDIHFVTCSFYKMYAVTFFNCKFENCDFKDHHYTHYREGCTFDDDCTGYENATSKIIDKNPISDGSNIEK